ncbi:MAG TPA: hypothetical protein DEP35_19470 [Deltaproteobacteria bacterium]|jgi:hypothetical protein|nr:hypothetical protein [Deltaproteobacteria bacterium]
MAKRSSHRRTSLARRTVSVKPVVIRQTKVVKAKHRRHGRAAFGGFLGAGQTEMLIAGAALGFLDKSSFVASLPKLPFLGEHGTIAVGAYMLSRSMRNPILGNIAKGAMFLSAYEMVKQGSITGDDPFGM